MGEMLYFCRNLKNLQNGLDYQSLYIKSLGNGLVEVTDKCCKKKENAATKDSVNQNEWEFVEYIVMNAMYWKRKGKCMADISIM